MNPLQFSNGMNGNFNAMNSFGVNGGSPMNGSPMNANFNMMAMNANKPVKQRKANELFVGDLSFFCTEAHLFDLFSEFGNVEAVRIVRNDQKKRTMGFGFVTMESPHVAKEVAKVLNNHLFMGRIMKVEQSDYKSSPTSLETSPGFQVHVSFSATFNSPEEVVIPTESFLRKAFIKFGTILDVVVREFTINMNVRRLFGYAFVAFEREQSALTAIAEGQEIVYQSITLRCTHSYRSLQAKANNQPSMPSFGANGNAMQRSSNGNGGNMYSQGGDYFMPSNNNNSVFSSNAPSMAQPDPFRSFLTSQPANNGMFPAHAQGQYNNMIGLGSTGAQKQSPTFHQSQYSSGNGGYSPTMAMSKMNLNGHSMDNMSGHGVTSSMSMTTPNEAWISANNRSGMFASNQINGSGEDSSHSFDSVDDLCVPTSSYLDATGSAAASVM